VSWKLEGVRWTFALLLLTACGKDDAETGQEGEDGDADTDTDADGDADGDTDGDTDTNPAWSPVVLTADAWCYHHATGKEFNQWLADCTYDDPQGVETVSTMQGNSLGVLSSGTEVAVYALACRDGACNGSFKEEEDGVLCDSAASYTVRFVVMDEDGHRSAPYDVQGRRE
jgi:hypothetical protein